jgi:hypothetical protein
MAVGAELGELGELGAEDIDVGQQLGRCTAVFRSSPRTIVRRT